MMADNESAGDLELPEICVVHVSNPRRVLSLEVLQNGANVEISPGENYGQCEYVGKSRRSVHFRRHAKLTQVVTGSDLHDEKRLRQAVSSGQQDLVRKFLVDGVDPCCRDDKERSPLHIAAASGNIDIVRLLLESGANPNQKDSIGNTPLHLAACSNNIPVVTALLQRGTDVNQLDKSGRSPLHLALGRLRLLRSAPRYTSDQLKAEVVQIINMLQVYVTAVGSKQDDDDRTNFASKLDSLSSQLEQMTTVCDIDRVSGLLSDVAQLQIERTTDHQLVTAEIRGRALEQSEQGGRWGI